MKAFDKNKKYTFSKAKWLMDTRNVWIYEAYQPIREWADKADGREVVNISADGTVGYVNKHIVTPESCDIAKSAFHEVFSTAVKRILHEDREDKLLERINMIEDEINELEMNVSILQDEQDSLLEELRELQNQQRQAEDIAWRQMKL
jgi:preprotein translocase subunit SecD